MSIVSRGLCAAAAAGLLATLPAQALTLNFSGSGFVTGDAQTPPFFNNLYVEPADSSYTFNGEDGWTLFATFSGEATTIGPGGLEYLGTMSGQFVRGEDTLPFVGSQFAPTLGGPIALSYTVFQGTGAYANYVGSGFSTVVLMGDPFGLPTPVPFMEMDGVLNLTPVPEPGTWALWAGGLAALSARARRRRA